MIKINNNFQDSIINKSLTMKNAMEKIGLSKIQILMIIDENNKFIGTITDGDIRRSILKGLPMDTAVINITNLNPKYLKQGTSVNEIFKLMRKEQIGQIPILNSEHEIINIAVDESFANNQDLIDNKVIVLAGGKGVRLRPITISTPKPLIKIGEEPIIGTIIKNFLNQGLTNFIISLNYQKEKFYEYFKKNHKEIEIEFITENKELGTAGILGNLRKQTSPYVVINGDLLCKVNIRNMLLFHDENKADITIGIKKIEDNIPYGVIEFNKREFKEIKEKPAHIYNIVGGIYIFSEKLKLDFIDNKKIDMPDLINKMQSNGKKICLYPIEEYWIDIGNLTELERAKLDFSSEFEY